MAYHLGIDAGSKTIKLVLLNDEGSTVFSQYELHRSDIITTMKTVLHDTIWRFGDAEVTVCVTGSAGMRLAELLNAPHVQEVIATRSALERLIPEADVAIELGGEDAKIIYLSGGVEQRMNGVCAGGTGGFIDLMCSMLGVRAKQFNMMALGYQTIYPIASRCAVFAQTDVRPLLNEGARRGDIAASILQAVVTQTIAGLSCGRPIKGTVVFLGGPFEVYSELVSRFRQTLGLSFKQTVKPPDAHLFVAKGAALLGAQENTATASTQKVYSLQSLYDLLEAAPAEADGGIGRLKPLFATDEERADFQRRHARDKVRRARLMNTTGDIFIGIDAGSTTVKLAVVNEAGELIYSSYEKSRGEVLETARDMLDELYSSLPHEYDGDALVTIRHTKVTGYGERLLRVAFDADSGIVETVAHLRAAQELEPEVDFVLDIGGQDIKCMRVKDGAIDDIMLNESCSSGCGALIDGFSRSLGFTKWSFSSIALESTCPVDLGTRCTVFMTSRVRHAQKEGINAADIAAGLAYSVVRNALHKVIGCSDASRLGTRVVVQGGTFRSDAVLRAFELESGLEVVRPDIAELMGAYGAALLARDEGIGARDEGGERGVSERDERDEGGEADAPAWSSLLTPMELACLKRTQSTRRCQGCANTCLLTINTFTPREDAEQKRAAPLKPRSFITGNRCERMGAKINAADDMAYDLPNLLEYERQLLAAYDKAAAHEHDESGLTVGIPATLDLYETYPFWQTFFSRLGMRTVRASSSNSDIYRKGAHAVMSEGSCYPAKLTHGHVVQLIERGADLIFMPTGGAIASAQKGVREAGQSLTIECPVSSNYATLISDDVAQLLSKTCFLSCDTASSVPLAQQLTAAFACVGNDKAACRGLDEERVCQALEAAAKEQELFYERCANRSAEALAFLEQKGAHGIVLAGHPYHVDSGMSHGVDSLLNSLGFAVLSASGLLALRRRDGVKNAGTHYASRDDDTVAATWTQPNALYELAHLVAGHERLDLVQIYSFGCGVDALSTGQVRAILEGAGKLYTALKMDEMVDLAAIRIRLRSLAAALKARGRRPQPQLPQLPQLPQPLQSSQPVQSPQLSQSEHRLSRPDSDVEQACAPAAEAPLLIMPALASLHLAAIKRVAREAGYQLEVLPEIDAKDVEYGLRFCNNDLCHSMIAVAGQLIRFLKERASNAVQAAHSTRDFPTEPVTIIIPQVCCGCRAVELASVVRAQLKNAQVDSHFEVIGIPSHNDLFTMPAWLATRFYDELAAVDVAAEVARKANLDPKSPPVGIIGTAGLLYTPQLNRDLLKRVVEEGCMPCAPPITDVLSTNAPLERCVDNFVERGIYDIICIQGFGCLNGHIHGRGAAKRLKKRHPKLNISFIDYDPGASEVNQTSRLKLALTLAKEH
jgi:predicted CoA-substrate-specific enzyme activase